MSAGFDPAAGRWVLSRTEFDALRADPDAADVPELARPALRVAADPDFQLRGTATEADGTVRGLDGWLGPELLVCLAKQAGDQFRVGTYHPSYVPVVLAWLIGLGPQPSLADATLQLPSMLLPGLLATADERRTEAVESLVDALSEPARQASVRAFGAGPVRQWRLALWPAGDPTAGSRLDGIHTRGGLWLRMDDGLNTTLIPCRPATVWQALALLVPVTGLVTAGRPAAPGSGRPRGGRSGRAR